MSRGIELEKLPPEMLCHVGAYLNFNSIYRLWTTNKSIASKLKNHLGELYCRASPCQSQFESQLRWILKFENLQKLILKEPLLSVNQMTIDESTIQKLFDMMRHLKHLQVTIPISSGLFRGPIQFPVHLSYLNLNSELDQGSLIKLPASFQTLIFSGNNTFNNHQLTLLPKQLLHLDLSSNTNINDDGIVHLPKTLIVLKLTLNNHLTWQSLPHLPPRLIDLTLGRVNVTNNALKCLPSSLRSLSFVAISKLENKPFELPSLTRLSLGECPSFTDHMMQWLPSTLLELDLSQIEGLTDACIAYLPNQLTLLNLMCTRHLTDAAVPQFPKTLTLLNLHSNVGFTNAAIKNLPRSLKILDLSSSSELTNACMLDMPDQLECLFMRFCSKINNECLKYKPMALKTIVIQTARSYGKNNTWAEKIQLIKSWLKQKFSESMF